MELTPLRSFRDEFAKHARWTQADELRAFNRSREEADKKREQVREDHQDTFEDMAMTVLATESEIAEFSLKLDAYDTATVDALMENERQLTEVRVELQVLLDKAYILPDGRRVFKTEDGSRVFDEHGLEVKNVEPENIEDWRPTWERYEKPFLGEKALTEQREDLFEFQKMSDDARAEIDEGGISAERLKELEETLAKNAPDAVKQRMGMETDAAPAHIRDEPEQATSYRPGVKLDMPAL